MTDLKLQSDVSYSGFRPQLFTVAAGSYASDATYGSNTDPTGDYSSVAIVSESIAKTRVDDNQVDFDVQISLDATAADPAATGGDELRIRVVPRVAGEPQRYRQGLPPSKTPLTLPLFTDVDVILKSTGATSGTLTGLLEARLLYGNELALVARDTTATPPAHDALTATSLSALFGQQAADSILITVRGQYRTPGSALSL